MLFFNFYCYCVIYIYIFTVYSYELTEHKHKNQLSNQTCIYFQQTQYKYVIYLIINYFYISQTKSYIPIYIKRIKKTMTIHYIVLIFKKYLNYFLKSILVFQEVKKILLSKGLIDVQ